MWYSWQIHLKFSIGAAATDAGVSFKSLKMTDIQNAKVILRSDDPLSDDAMKWLINHKEEDLFVDYKESFDGKDEKQWNGITIDAMAFANTMGGFVVFGIRDSDFSIVGLDKHTVKILTDTNQILQKFNRYLSPQLSLIRTKEINTDDGKVVVMYVPESRGKTHIFIKDVNYKLPSGQQKKNNQCWDGFYQKKRN